MRAFPFSFNWGRKAHLACGWMVPFHGLKSQTEWKRRKKKENWDLDSLLCFLTRCHVTNCLLLLPPWHPSHNGCDSSKLSSNEGKGSSSFRWHWSDVLSRQGEGSLTELFRMYIYENSFPYIYRSIYTWCMAPKKSIWLYFIKSQIIYNNLNIIIIQLKTLCWIMSWLYWFLSLWPKLELSEKRQPLLKKCPHQIGLWTHLWAIFLINDPCGRVKTIVGDATPGKGKKAGWASHGGQATNQLSPVASASVRASRFLPWTPCLTSLHEGL